MANKNNNKPQITKQYIDLYYMTSTEVRAKDIAGLLQDTTGLQVQLWEEMNVLELELPNQNSVDFEPIDPSFKDPSDSAFIKNRSIKTIFAITLCDADLSTVIPYFDQIVNKYSGFVCADSEDFTPVYSGSSKR